MIIPLLLLLYFIWLFSAEMFNARAPAARRKDPSFPIVAGTGHPSSGNMPAFRVKYLDHIDHVREECMHEKMAKQIPEERIFPSCFRGEGVFAHTCPTQEAVSYKIWPF